MASRRLFPPTLQRYVLLRAALLLTAAVLLLAAACGGAGPSNPGSPSASASPVSTASPSATGDAVHVRTVGPDSVLLRSRRRVRFRFRFLGVAPPAWRWRVTDFYGGNLIAGQGETADGSSTGSVTWTGLRPDGSRADPGLYLVEVGAVGAPARSMTRIGWVRFEPPVKARVYTRLPAAGRRVALTFDDGGGKTAWYWILRELRAAHAKGTFFPIGRYVGGYAKRMAGLTIKDHMAIGSHSWSHPLLTWLSKRHVRAQLRRAERVWWRDFRASPVPYLRPPYGAYNARTLAIAGRLGYSRIIMWDVDALDWANPGVHAIVRNVLDNVRPGSIILMHMRGKTPAALPRIIAGLRARHYEMVTLPELFAAAGYR
jgi:peptidoglycan/xylan/chitin deacetylase (PgdA/CDA1 family)